VFYPDRLGGTSYPKTCEFPPPIIPVSKQKKRLSVCTHLLTALYSPPRSLGVWIKHWPLTSRVIDLPATNRLHYVSLSSATILISISDRSAIDASRFRTCEKTACYTHRTIIKFNYTSMVTPDAHETTDAKEAQLCFVFVRISEYHCAKYNVSTNGGCRVAGLRQIKRE
jgi:hypothetical protein